MRYRAEFNGRRVGAIGIMYDINTTCQGDNHEQAKLDLYNQFEHITKLKLTPMVDGESDGTATSET